MNINDIVKSSNSWHWLAVTVVVAAVGSVFIPEWGWRDVLDHSSRTLAGNEKRIAAKLDETRDLALVDVGAVKEATKNADDELVALRESFARLGMEALPAGASAVFTAQSRVGEALMKHKLSVVSTGAKVADRTSTLKPSVQPKPVAKKATVADAKRQLEAALASTNDPEIRRMIEADGRRMIARIEAEEKKAAAEAKNPPAPVRTAPVQAAKASFQSETLDYEVTGDFRDMFMFLLGETHKRPYYNFKDISVSCPEEGPVRLSFLLQVNHK